MLVEIDVSRRGVNYNSLSTTDIARVSYTLYPILCIPYTLYILYTVYPIHCVHIADSRALGVS